MMNNRIVPARRNIGKIKAFLLDKAVAVLSGLLIFTLLLTGCGKDAAKKNTREEHKGTVLLCA